MSHCFTPVLEQLQCALDGATDLDPALLTPDRLGATLLDLRRLHDRLAELVLRLMHSGEAVAEQSGARDMAAWLVARRVADPRPAHRELRLAQALARWEATGRALAAGRLGLDHAEIITRALDDLPDALPDEWSPEAGRPVIQRAEQHLIDLSAEHGPAELRRLAAHLIEVVAPEVAEAAEGHALRRLEERARAKATLSLTPEGAGLTRVHGQLPDAVAERLRILLEAYAQPRLAALEADGRARPRDRLFAEAFAHLLETVEPDRLPAHGGDATTIVVTVPLGALRDELGRAGHAALGDVSVTAGEARRLACGAMILPAVLDGAGQPLDLGRARRLFTPAQRRALRLRDGHCRAEGCTVPARWCDAHHREPWHSGGATDLDNGVLLCGHHHRRAHDPAYDLTRLPNGDHRYHLRT